MEPPAAKELTIEIWADTHGVGTCRGCRLKIKWAEVVESGKKMPFDQARFAVVSQRMQDGRVIERVYRHTNHWSTCPNRKDFTR